MEFTVESLTIDFGIMSLLLIFAKIMRTKIKILQNFYVPTALIAGILGVILGKYGFDILPFSSQASSYSGYLFNLLFASLFIGKAVEGKASFFSKLKKSGDSVCLTISGFTGLYGVAAVVGATILVFFFDDIYYGFGVLAATGFAGGHGSAAALGTAFQASGWGPGLDVANTFATIGLLVGVFAGVALIKYATNKKYTQIIDKVEKLPEDVRTGLIKKEQQVPLATETVSSMSIETLAWHFALIIASATVGILFNKYVMKELIPDLIFPDYTFALIFGVIIFFILEKVGYSEYIDKKTINHLGAGITDYLVGFGVAMINIQIVLDYWLALLIMCVIVTLLNVFYLFFISRRLYNTYWFERGIYTFGMYTGVASIGVLLLRVVDPEYKTGALEDIGVSLIALTPVEMVIVSMTPIMFIQGFGLVWGLVMLATSILALVLCKLFFTKKSHNK